MVRCPCGSGYIRQHAYSGSKNSDRFTCCSCHREFDVLLATPRGGGRAATAGGHAPASWGETIHFLWGLLWFILTLRSLRDETGGTWLLMLFVSGLTFTLLDNLVSFIWGSVDFAWRSLWFGGIWAKTSTLLWLAATAAWMWSRRPVSSEPQPTSWFLCGISASVMIVSLVLWWILCWIGGAFYSRCCKKKSY